MKTINLTTDEEITLKLTIEEKLEGNLSRMNEIYTKVKEFPECSLKELLIEFAKDLSKESDELDRILSYLK